MNAQDLNVSVIANNLANVNTSGFKRSRADFQDLLYQNLRVVGALSNSGNQVPTGVQLGLGVKTAAIQKVFVQGDNAQTGNPLDLSIQGDGFFQVTMPDGTLAYTRAGSMKLDNTGAIVTSDGLRMNPAITIPSNAISISVDSVGTVAVTQQGTAAPVTLGTIQLATFQNPAGLQAIGQNLYKESGSSGTPLTANPGTGNAGTILQGSLELSNVSVVEEMVNLITAQRAYEVNSKSVQTADQMLQVSNNLVR